MTTLYRPVLIESAEQAEALPVGTVAIESGRQGQTVGASIRVHGGWYITGEEPVDGTPHLYKHRDMVGDQALVPSEAEEEKREHPTRYEETPRPGETYRRPATMTRLVTPWEEA